MTEVTRARCEILEQLFDAAPMKRAFGMDLHYDAEERAVFTQRYNPAFDHSMGGIHGGVFATLLDNAGWFTCAVQYETWIVTVELQVRLLEAVRGETLVASGRILRAGKHVASAEMEVLCGTRRVAVGAGTFATTGVPLKRP